MLFKELLIWAFWGQNVGPGWVKNGKKKFFSIPTTFMLTQFCLKMSFLTGIVS